MRVLVTGGTGWIGQTTCAELQKRGHEIQVFDAATGCDVCDCAQLDQAVADADAVINLAGVLGTAETVGAERAPIEVNVLGAVNVFEVAARRDVPVVQIGTGHKGQLNPYAITKACAEDLALARARWVGQRISVVRAFHAYGDGQKIPPPHGIAKVRKIIPSFICRALTGMPLEIYGLGEQTIDLVHVTDVALCLVDALEGPWGEVIEAGTGMPTTVLDAARAVIEACGSNSETMHLPMRPGEPEGAHVVATSPACHHPWPWRLDETIAWYEAILREDSYWNNRVSCSWREKGLTTHLPINCACSTKRGC